MDNKCLKNEEKTVSLSYPSKSLNRLQAVQSQPENHMSNACIRKDDFSGETIRRQPS